MNKIKKIILSAKTLELSKNAETSTDKKSL